MNIPAYETVPVNHTFTTLEINASGIFDNPRIAKKFNAATGKNLHITKSRTILDEEQFLNSFFAEDGEGTYLEKCCGSGNVKIEISKAFQSLHCLSGPRHKLSELERIFERRESTDFWNQTTYQASSLLTLDEIEKITRHPIRVVMVRGFGIVNPQNIDRLREWLR